MKKRVSYMVSYMVEDGNFHVMHKFDGWVNLGDPQLSREEGLRVIAELRNLCDEMQNSVDGKYEER